MARMHRTFLLIMTILALPAVAPAQDEPVKESFARITYNPEQTDIFTDLDNMQVVYVANFWNTRSGTRLALRENILRPDSSRLMTAPLVKDGPMWKADLNIPLNAAVLSYYITDGNAIDNNKGETFTAYVYSSEGKPVANAHYFMVPFLELAGAGIEERYREAEQEVLTYPENFRAYIQYFALWLELEKGSERGQGRIMKKLDELEQAYPGNSGCLNLIARTYYYILRNQDKGLEYKEKVPQLERWREVEAIFDSREFNDEQRARATQMEKARNALLNSEAPDIDFIEGDGRIAVKDLAGKPVVLVFWATTSGLSLEMFQTLEDLQQKYDDKGLTVLTINTGEAQADVDAFKKAHNYPFLWAMNNGSAIFLYGVSGLPQAYVIDRKGIIRSIVAGWSPSHAETLRNGIEKVL